MGVYESGAKIKKCTQEIDLIWEQTQAAWKDVKAKQFEDEFIRAIGVEIRKAQTALQNMAPLINQVRAELKDQ
jgi:hypothetical protein